MNTRRSPRLMALVSMVRWRAIVTLLLTMSVGAAWHGAMGIVWPMPLAALALACAYTAASACNDIADRRIDTINLPGAPERPLVTGAAGVRDLIAAAGVCAVVAIAAAFAVGTVTGVAIFAALVLYAAYSLPPLHVSHHMWLSAPYLAVGYAVIPFVAGADAVRGYLGGGDVLIVAALYLMLMSRMYLKDLRDRRGDAAMGKATIVLRFGKPVAVRLSAMSLVAGLCLFVAALSAHPAALAATPACAAAVALVMRRLQGTRRLSQEVILVALGARMGNGLLLTTIAVMILSAAGADVVTLAVAAVMFSAPFVMTLQMYVADPASFRLAGMHVDDDRDDSELRSAA